MAHGFLQKRIAFTWGKKNKNKTLVFLGNLFFDLFFKVNFSLLNFLVFSTLFCLFSRVVYFYGLFLGVFFIEYFFCVFFKFYFDLGSRHWEIVLSYRWYYH